MGNLRNQPAAGIRSSLLVPVAAALALMLALRQDAVASPPDEIGTALALATAFAQSESADAGEFRSVRMQIKTPALAGYAILDFAQDRELFATSRGTAKSVAYMSGNTIYSQDGAGRWIKLDLRSVPAPTSRAGSAKAPSALWAHKRMLPDRTVDGKRMGVLSFDVPARAIDAQLSSAQTVTVTCLYEKVSRRPHSCAAPNVLQLSFDRYNDSRNDIRIPPAALNAPTLNPGMMR